MCGKAQVVEKLGAFPRDVCVDLILLHKQTDGGMSYTVVMCLSAFACVAQGKLLPHFDCGLF